MKTKDNNNLFQKLRTENPFFNYESFEFNMDDGELSISYVFNLSGKTFFKPKIRVPANPLFNLDKVNKRDMETLIFNMGMVELISYWKAACPKEVNIIPNKLSSEKVEFWKKLYFHGLGEFYYLNGIHTTQDSSMSIFSKGEPNVPIHKDIDGNKVIVPIGGGKDSIVTLELLKASDLMIIPLIINPREASWQSIENAGFKRTDCLVVYRSIDGELLDLNSKGYLNGHTPFSAMLAFTSSLMAYLTGAKHIALSNESSANESTVPDSKINHQYSKSYEFEYDFHTYSRKYLIPDLNYFSFLRPLNEIQIAKLFSGFENHLYSFRSCNVGSKENSWCGNCPKCLFTYIILKPFVDETKLIKVFGKDLLSKPSLNSTLKELKGEVEVKPFECVGTPEEVIASLNYLTDKLAFKNLLKEYNNENFLDEKFEEILKKALNDQ